MSSTVLTEWMRNCAECTTLAVELAMADGSPALIEIDAAADFEAHLLESHLGQIPGYRDDCEDCQEWKVIAASDAPDVPSWWTVRTIARSDLQHRAGHVVWGE